MSGKISSAQFAILWAQITRLETKRLQELQGMIAGEVGRRTAPKPEAQPSSYPTKEQ